MRTAIAFVVCFLCAVVFAGCGGSEPKPIPAKGIVKFDDGTIPQGEVAVIRFEPVASVATEGSPQAGVASANLQPDGRFVLGTLDKDDGAYAGDYKVVIVLRKSYLEGGDVVHPKFAKAATTPLSATVSASQTNDFELVVQKP